MNHSGKNQNHKSISVLISSTNLKITNILKILLLLSVFSINTVFGAGAGLKRQVIISFDDGYYSVYKYAYPVLKKYNIPITLAVITSYLEKSNKVRPYASANLFMNRGEVQEMINSLDIEVASHSVDHKDLTKLNDDEVRYELRKSKQILDSLFNQETITFVYPYGAVNRKIIDMTKSADYKLGRSIRWGEPNLWVDRYLLPIKEVRNTTTIDEILNHIKYHKTTILLFHRLLPQPTVFTEYSVDRFDDLLTRLVSNENIEFLTLRDLYQQWWQDIMLKYVKEKGWLNKPILFQKIDIDQTGAFNSSTGQ
jgi:peptidoglycan/xylan/chitin deacetylase (PgdA/CDA1 family)